MVDRCMRIVRLLARDSNCRMDLRGGKTADWRQNAVDVAAAHGRTKPLAVILQAIADERSKKIPIVVVPIRMSAAVDSPRAGQEPPAAHERHLELVRREPLGERLEARQQPRGYRGVAHDQEQRFDREAHVGRDPDRVQRWASGAHARTDEVSRQESMGRHGHGDGAGARRGRVLTVTIADDAITSTSVVRHVLPSV